MPRSQALSVPVSANNFGGTFKLANYVSAVVFRMGGSHVVLIVEALGNGADQMPFASG